MKTRKNYHTSFHEGDSCNVSSKLSYEERLIEDHPQHLLEDLHKEAAAFAGNSPDAPGTPVAGGGSSRLWAWCVAALVGLFIVGAGLYIGYRNNGSKEKVMQLASATTSIKRGGVGNDVSSGKLSDGIAAHSGTQGAEENYIYYFGNDVSSVADNPRIEDMAEKIESRGGNVVVTAFASTVGDEDYNRHLSERRGESVAKYLIAHGVPADHIKIISSGETANYGDDANNRRANIHVVYPG